MARNSIGMRVIASVISTYIRYLSKSTDQRLPWRDMQPVIGYICDYLQMLRFVITASIDIYTIKEYNYFIHLK